MNEKGLIAETSTFFRQNRNNCTLVNYPFKEPPDQNKNSQSITKKRF
jgi:hypothetical protein